MQRYYFGIEWKYVIKSRSFVTNSRHVQGRRCGNLVASAMCCSSFGTRWVMFSMSNRPAFHSEGLFFPKHLLG